MTDNRINYVEEVLCHSQLTLDSLTMHRHCLNNYFE